MAVAAAMMLSAYRLLGFRLPDYRSAEDMTMDDMTLPPDTTEEIGEPAMLRALIDSLPDVNIYIKDTLCRFLTANTAMLRMLGLEKVEEIEGKTDFDFFHKKQAEEYHSYERAVMRTGEPLVNHEELIPQRDGPEKWYLTTKVPLLTADGSVAGLVCISQDITKRKKLEEEILKKNVELERMSLTDPLTGAYNRRYLDTEFSVMFNAFSRTGKAVTVVTIDIDDFKQINDAYGHAVGDRVLRSLATAARRICKRKSDLLVRLGGDEFILVLFNTLASRPEGVTDLKTAGEFAQELLEAAREIELCPGGEPGTQRHPTLSIGIAELRKDEGFESLFARSDRAMYAAKKEGKDRAGVYAEETVS